MPRMEAVSCAVSHTLLRAVHMDLGKDPMDSKSRSTFVMIIAIKEEILRVNG